MNILFTAVIPSNSYHGGVEKVTDTLCREFIRIGHKVYYLHLMDNYDKMVEFQYPTKFVTILPESCVNSDKNIEFYNQFINDNKIDVIINQNGLYDGASLFCKVYDKQVKLISVVHNNPLLNYNYLWGEVFCLRNNTWIERLKRIARCVLFFKIKRQRLSYLKQHYIQFDNGNHSELVLLSSRYIQPLLKIAPHLSPKLHAIANPNSYNEVVSIPSKRMELLYVGRLDNRSKKVNRLLRIWKYLYKRFPKWELSIVGDGPDKTHLEVYSKRLGLENVIFYGYSDPRPFYERASIICMTSDYEGFPMVLTEAMQFGCVPIAYDSFEAVRDIIIDGKTGALVKPFKERQYVKALYRIMKDETYRVKLSKSSYEYVKKFDVGVVIKAWLNLISK